MESERYQDLAKKTLDLYTFSMLRPSFTWIKDYCIPIYPKDWSKVFPLAWICFFLSFNYYILKTLKDALVITAKGSGAEAIPFIKVWLLLPASILMAIAFTWMANHFTIKTIFNILISFFLLFFFLFAFVFYPYQHLFHAHGLADHLQLMLPEGWKGFVASLRYWPFSFFYVMAECWSSIVYSVLFWGLANEVTKLSDAQRFYPLLILAGNLAAIAAGETAIFLSSEQLSMLFPIGKSAWEQSLILLTTLVLLCGIVVLFIFHWAYAPLVRLKEWTQPLSKQMTFRESIAFLLSSRYLLSIAGLVFFYNVVINLTEVEWKNQILKAYPDPKEYALYMNKVTTWIGMISTFLTLFFCSYFLKTFGWRFTALFTPLVTLATGLAFFGLLLISDKNLLAFATTLGVEPLLLLTFIGSLHICLSRSGRYTLFDTTKEIAFIPLSSDEKLKGKAAVDGIGSRLGKGSSSCIYQILLIGLPSLSACIPFVAVILCVALVVCIFCVNSLGHSFSTFTRAAPID